MFRRKKAVDLSELQSNPHFPFYVGRLVGAAEVTSHWLSLQHGTEYQEMGQRLGMVVNWFLPGGPAEMGTAEYPTAILPPKTTPPK
jgi:hypothetical protein